MLTPLQEAPLANGPESGYHEIMNVSEILHFAMRHILKPMESLQCRSIKTTSQSRPEWDEYFLAMAKTAALRADCTRSKVGAILVDENHRIVSTGYNGAPSGTPGCLTANACPRGRMTYEEHPPEGSYSNCIANHAERNAIVYANPEDRKGSTLYITRRPCTDCHELILQEGILWIIWETSDGQIARERQYH